MSFDDQCGSTTMGTYDNLCKYIDSIVEETEVSIVAVSGNTFYDVTSPGMSYNAITVGSFDDKNTTTINPCNDILSAFSGYWEDPAYYYRKHPEKPDILSPGQRITVSGLPDGTANDDYPYGVSSGTSFAAPQVSGTLAQLIYVSNNLKYRLSLSKALINVSAKYKIDDSSFTVSGMDKYSDTEGAGKLSARNAAWVLASGRYKYYLGGTSTFPSSPSIPFTVLSSDQMIRVALAWEKREGVDISNLNLKVVTSDNTVVSSQSVYNNVEVIEFTLPELNLYGRGTYYIIIERNSGTGIEWLSIAWY